MLSNEIAEECRKKMQSQMQIRDDLISNAVDVDHIGTSSSEIVVNSTVNLAQMTKNISELSVLFRKMVEMQHQEKGCSDKTIAKPKPVATGS